MAVDLVEGGPREQVARVAGHRLDVALTRGPSGDPDLAVLTLGVDPLLLAIARHHVLAELEIVAWDDLVGERVIARQQEPVSGFPDRSRTGTPAVCGLPIETFTVGRDTLLELVAVGFGVAVVVGSGVRRDRDDVVFRPMAPPGNVVELEVRWLASNDNPALRGFIDIARDIARGDAG